MRLHLFFILAAITLIATLTASQAKAVNSLHSLTKTKSEAGIQLYFTFASRPLFSSNTDSRRLDLIFPETSLSKDFQPLEAGDGIVKILTREFQGKLAVSIFFRYQPQDFSIHSGLENSIVLDVMLGNEYSKSYNELAKRLKGLQIINNERNVDFSNPVIRSPYAKDWLSFFSDYQPDVKIDIPVNFTAPPFPIIALIPPKNKENIKVLSDNILAFAADGLWAQVATAVREEILHTKTIQKQKFLALTYGEALARMGNFKPAYQQLYLLAHEYEEERISVYAKYWLTLLQAIMENPVNADYQFRTMEKIVPDNSPLAPYFLLSRIETALAAKDYKRMNTLLQNDTIALPQEIHKRIAIRQADYWSSINELVKAYAAYNLLGESPQLQSQPYSYNNFCITLYAQQKFEDAAKCYQRLRTTMIRPNLQGIISYQEIMARLQMRQPLLINKFAQIGDAYPETEASYLAQLKESDLRLLKGLSQTGKKEKNEFLETMLTRYKTISTEGIKRNIREGALFKIILLEDMLGKKTEAISDCQKFLREFLSGPVRISAEAFLIDTIPQEIERLVQQKQYVKALVLAQQNRFLFEKGWINSSFLIDLAEAYQKLSLFGEAEKLYRYLLEVLPTDKKEKFYSIIAEAALDAGNFALIEEYASQYAYNYGEGKYSLDLLYLRLQSRITRNLLDEASLLMPKKVPEQLRFQRMNAHLAFQRGEYNISIASFKNVELQDKLSSTEQFMLAESLFQTGKYSRAQEYFLLLDQDHPHHHQTLYRLAEISKQQGDKNRAEDILQELREQQNNSLWKQLAERELQYESIK